MNGSCVGYIIHHVLELSKGGAMGASGLVERLECYLSVTSSSSSSSSSSSIIKIKRIKFYLIIKFSKKEKKIFNKFKNKYFFQHVTRRSSTRTSPTTTRKLSNCNNMNRSTRNDIRVKTYNVAVNYMMRIKKIFFSSP